MHKRIIGAVGVGNHTFRAGQEAEFEAAATEAGVDFARLEAKGVITGFAGKAAAASEPSTDAAPPKAAAKKAAKKATKRGR